MRRNTKEQFVERARETHGTLYDYSETNYIKSNVATNIGCRIHGEFLMRPDNHISGQGCPTCSKIKTLLSTEDWIEKAKAVHKDAPYSYIKSEYTGYRSPVVITCRVHGDFTHKSDKILRGSGCPSCSQSFW